MHELLTPAAMAQADSLTIAKGLRGSVLMERAGRAVADAALAAQAWDQPVVSFDDLDFSSCDLVIDALFGAGLTRPITDDYAQVIDRLNQSGRPVLAVDVPSGVDGRSGQVLGPAVRARGRRALSDPNAILPQSSGFMDAQLARLSGDGA